MGVRQLDDISVGGSGTTVAGPVGVEELTLGLIGTLVGVGTEIVALSLDHVGGSASTTETIVVGKTSRDGGSRDTVGGGLDDNTAPANSAVLDLGSEELVEEQVGEIGVLLEGLEDVLEVLGADDATTAPHESDTTVVKIPLELERSSTHQDEALSARDEERGIDSITEIVEESGTITFPGARGAGENLRGQDTLVLLGREATTEDGLSDESDGDAEIQSVDTSPLTSTLLAGSVEDVVNDVVTLIVLLGADGSGDLNKVRVQITLVPFFKDFGDGIIVHLADVAHQVVGLGDGLAA